MAIANCSDDSATGLAGSAPSAASGRIPEDCTLTSNASLLFYLCSISRLGDGSESIVKKTSSTLPPEGANEQLFSWGIGGVFLASDNVKPANFCGLSGALGDRSSASQNALMPKR